MSTETVAALPNWSIRLITELTASDESAKELVAGLNPEQLNWHPAPGAWSVGQCLEHLCITNEGYLPVISASLAGRPSAAVQEITPGWFARWFIRSFIEPTPQTKRASAPKKIAPGVRVELSVLDRFLRGNQAVRELVRHAGQYDVNHIRFSSPFIPLLRFTVGSALQIIAGHQRRHLLQAERARRSSGFPQ
ncbi:MAG TPA: DinB family protein [Candidatus Saccharimonadales bacterium]|jgi:hypothetical protein|nr:DinB family protein [Candidatus Saccharimonadales bacterium]